MPSNLQQQVSSQSHSAITERISETDFQLPCLFPIPHSLTWYVWKLTTKERERVRESERAREEENCATLVALESNLGKIATPSAHTH